MHNMQDIWSVRFTCLLVCQPAIFVDSKIGDAEEFYPDEHPQILEREVGYIFPLMEVEPTICIELKNEEDEG